MKGLFITFEGPDGAGKTTQIQSLKATLELSGHQVIMTREPGGTAIGDRIRELLLSPEHSNMAEQTEVLLYAASRAQHVHDVILPALHRDCIILCDRFIDASIAYQAYGLGLDEQMVRSINAHASRGIQPDRTYMLDITVEEGQRRLVQRAKQSQGRLALDRIEQRDLNYHQRVREGFLHIAKQEKERVLLLDASRTMEEIKSDIVLDCERLLQQRIVGS